MYRPVGSFSATSRSSGSEFPDIKSIAATQADWREEEGKRGGNNNGEPSESEKNNENEGVKVFRKGLGSDVESGVEVESGAHEHQLHRRLQAESRRKGMSRDCTHRKRNHGLGDIISIRIPQIGSSPKSEKETLNWKGEENPERMRLN